MVGVLDRGSSESCSKADRSFSVMFLSNFSLFMCKNESRWTSSVLTWQNITDWGSRRRCWQSNSGLTRDQSRKSTSSASRSMQRLLFAYLSNRISLLFRRLIFRFLIRMIFSDRLVRFLENSRERIVLIWSILTQNWRRLRRKRGRVVTVSDPQSSGPGFESRSDH